MAEYKVPTFNTIESSEDGRTIVSDAAPLPVTVAAGASSMTKAEDEAHVSADVGIMALAVRTDTPANRSNTDGDYEPLQMSAGRMWTSSIITSVVPGVAASSLGKAEDGAHTSADVGVLMLAVRRDAAAVGSDTDGDYSTINVDASGRQWVNTELPDAAALADAAANFTTPTAGAARLQFNGATWDRVRSNQDITIYASAARTADPTFVDQTNYNARGLHVVIDCTAIADSPSVVFTIEGKDAVSGKYYTILASAAIVGTGTTVLKVFPGSAVAANVTANDIIPRTWRVKAVHADSDSITYSVGVSLIL